MINYNIRDTVFDLKRTQKVIIGLGCSFVQGAELGDKIPEKIEKSFLNVLCQEYFNRTYTPINFGQEAAGNYAAIAKLFLHKIPWQDLEEIIVLFLPSGMQRFDIIRDDNTSLNIEFKTLWPNYSAPRVKQDEAWHQFNDGYYTTTYSRKFEVLNAILNFQILNSWVAANRAKLFVFPAFSREYSREYFLENIKMDIQRDGKTFLMHSGYAHNHLNYQFLVDSVPWDDFLTVDGSKTFFDLCWKQDKNYNPSRSMYEVMDFQLMANNDWIMPRGHPSAQGHKLLAEKLFEILVSKCSWTHTSLSR